MRGYLDTLAMADVTLDAATRERYLETVRHETGRLERIVADLLELAHHERGASAVEPRVFAIERVFEHVVRRHEREARAAGVRITTAVAPDADQVLADPGRLEQVTSNLVANALRHTPPGGTIHLEAAIVASGYRLRVEDSGEGIPAAHLPHVFDRFYKADAARVGSAGGSGLGLSIVKAIVERHGGTVMVESRPGRTAFAILLPRGATDVAAGQSRPSANR
jgi:signal transduction histidine kinase